MLPRRPSARGPIRPGSSNSHASSPPLGRICPGMEQSLVIVHHSLRESAGLIVQKSVRLRRNASNADDTWAPLMQPAPCGATHDKLTSNTHTFGLRGFATLRDVCLSPASHGSNVLESEMFPHFSALPPGPPQSSQVLQVLQFQVL